MRSNLAEVLTKNGTLRAVLEIVYFDPIKHWGRASVREPSDVVGGIPFHARDLPESLIGPSTEAFRLWRKMPKEPADTKREARKLVIALLKHGRFRADLTLHETGEARLVKGTVELVSLPPPRSPE